MTEGFDMYNGNQTNIGLQAMWTLQAGAESNMGVTTGRFAGQAFNIFQTAGGTNCWGRRLFDPAASTTALAFGVAVWTNSIAHNDLLVQIDNGSGNPLCSFGFTTAGSVYAASGSGGATLCNSAGGLFAAATWAYLEAEVVLSASVGSVNLYLNGNLVASATGVNTLASGGLGAFLRCWGRFDNALNSLFDDIYVVSGATRLGERWIETLRAANDSSANWTPDSGANNFSRVNETIVNGDSSYLQTAATNLRDLYGGVSLSTVPAGIDAVTVVIFAEKTSATTRQIYSSVRSGTTDSDGSAFNLAASYGRFDRILNVDPATSATWTASGVNNLLFGPKAA